MPSKTPLAQPTDYQVILEANFVRVFSERDAVRRAEAIRDLYAAEGVLYESDRAVKGHEAIAQATSELLASLPQGFVFSPIRPAQGHHGLARLQWVGGPPDGDPEVSGIDVAHIEDGLIRSLHVFLDQPEG